MSDDRPVGTNWVGRASSLAWLATYLAVDVYLVRHVGDQGGWLLALSIALLVLTIFATMFQVLRVYFAWIGPRQERGSPT